MCYRFVLLLLITPGIWCIFIYLIIIIQVAICFLGNGNLMITKRAVQYTKLSPMQSPRKELNHIRSIVHNFILHCKRLFTWQNFYYCAKASLQTLWSLLKSKFSCNVLESAWFFAWRGYLDLKWFEVALERN